MKAYIKSETIVLQEQLPQNIIDGEQVEFIIIPLTKKYDFPTFKLEVKDEYLKRERIYD